MLNINNIKMKRGLDRKLIFILLVFDCRFEKLKTINKEELSDILIYIKPYYLIVWSVEEIPKLKPKDGKNT